LLRAGDLTAIWVPREEDEALRDLVRARAFAKEDVRRARQRLLSFLLQHSVALPVGIRRWSGNFQRWLDGVSFAQRPSQIAFIKEYRYAERELVRRLERLEAELHALATESEHAPVIQALQALKGVREVTAVTLVAEVGAFSRFRSPAQLIAYAGLVPREYSSGAQSRRGGVTKTGNSHIRFALGEAAWANRFKPGVRVALRRRQEGLDPEVIQIAMKAQLRLHRKYWGLLGRGKQTTVAATAVAREMLGFIWSIACYVESKGKKVAA
jgi:transposase